MYRYELRVQPYILGHSVCLDRATIHLHLKESPMLYIILEAVILLLLIPSWLLTTVFIRSERRNTGTRAVIVIFNSLYDTMQISKVLIGFLVSLKEGKKREMASEFYLLSLCAKIFEGFVGARGREMRCIAFM